MQYLRQNTAVIVTVGPFYDKTDGVTIETGLTITNERITLTADTDDGSAPTNILDNVTGATSGTSNDLNYITGNDAGMMQLELSASNTNRVGRMLLSITDAANHVPVFHEYFVLPQAIYDWITGVIVPLPANVTTIAGSAVSTSTAQLGVNLVNIAGSAVSTTTAQLGVNAVQLSGDATAADNAESFFDGTGYAGTNNVIPTVTTVTNQLTAAQVATGVWQDATAGDFTTANSIGKALYINNIAPGASGGHMISGTNAGTTTLGALTITGATTLTGAVSGTNASNDLRGISVNMIKDQSITCTSGVTILASVGTAATSTAQTGDTYALANGANGFANIKTDTAAILVDTGTDGVVIPQAQADKVWGTAARTLTAATNITSTGGTTFTQTGDSFARLGAPAGASVSADIAAVKVDTAATLADTGTDGVVVAAASKTGYALTDAGVDAIWDRASSITLSFEALLTRAYQMINNKMNVTDATGVVALRAIGDGSTIATGSVTDNSTTTTRLELTWA